MPTGLVFPEASLQVTASFWSFLCVPHILVFLYVSKFSFLCGHSQVKLGSTHVILFNLNHLFMGSVSEHSHILRCQGLQLQPINLGGHKSAHNTELDAPHWIGVLGGLWGGQVGRKVKCYLMSPSQCTVFSTPHLPPSCARE